MKNETHGTLKDRLFVAYRDYLSLSEAQLTAIAIVVALLAALKLVL